MIQTASETLQKFQDSVGIKFQLYNSLFLSLPFYGVDKTGILLSLFNSDCEEGFSKGKSPTEIIENFFENHAASEKIDFLFRFVQYAERQVVLFDALEDAAFREINDTQGAGTLQHLEAAVLHNDKTGAFVEKLRNFSVRLVLTAHPTQFYPGSVLGIINDLTGAIKGNDVAAINTFLQQLGLTPFFKKRKPTPFDEATSLIWYLENVFYDAIGNIVSDLKNSFPAQPIETGELIKMGFWSGGDRDGNPFVTTETTLKTAAALRRAILQCYYRDVRRLKRRLTFSGVESVLAELDAKLYDESVAVEKESANLDKQKILDYLQNIRETLIDRHKGLFLHLVDNLIEKVGIFGLYFASLDVRQEASIHGKVLEDVARKGFLPEDYASLSDAQKIETLLGVRQTADAEIFDDELTKDTLRNVAAVRQIQRQNGAKGCERYIISQAGSALNVIEVYGLFLLGGWRAEGLSVDIVPLFETIADLKNAPGVMRELYEIPAYREHLARRDDTQTIMLGFSDGTKDGGYLMANWSIYKAKDELTRLSRERGINVIFFDGRGGPPARGGGKTHKFYSSMGENVSNQAIEVTIQGQTVSSSFGTIDAAQYNIEQLLHAGIYNHLFSAKENTFSPSEETLMCGLAEESFRAYEDLKNHPAFLDYLAHVSPLRFYVETNIGSRPAKRGAAGGKLSLKDLRAIPFVGAWSQLKQNVPGFYGVGAALEKSSEAGKLDEIKTMYRQNAFFKALIDNCEMAMQKSYFPLTRFLESHPVYGDLQRKIFDEFELCRRYLAEISEKSALMSDYPVEQKSIETRERIVLPLTTIQQYALSRIREIEENGNDDGDEKNTFEKLAMRCSFGIINAGRNSA
jgi:phosphoenolpyruvate carboxylase